MQVWSLVPVLRLLSVSVIVPLFTLNEQLFEESVVLTVSQVKELLELNAGILETLEELKVRLPHPAR